MSEKLPNRPVGAYDDDLSELNDRTIEDIATAKLTSPEDRQNAKAEIAARQAAGTYDPQNSPHTSRSDLLANGYGVENGKILYPSPEYKAWLKSDRNLTPPDAHRETIEDRAERLLKELSQSIGKAAFRSSPYSQPNSTNTPKATEQELYINHTATDTDYPHTSSDTSPKDSYNEYNLYDELFNSEKIHRPHKSNTKKDRLSKERQAHKKALDIELNARRKFKTHNKYDNNLLNQDRIDAAEAHSNLPIAESSPVPQQYNNISSTPEHPSTTSEQSNSLESAEKRATKVANYYKANFSKYASKWLARGVVSELARGVLDSPDSTLLTKGFSASEDAAIQSKIDPEGSLPYYDLAGITSDCKKEIILETIAKTNPFRPSKFAYTDQNGNRVTPRGEEDTSSLEKRELRAGDREIAIRRGIIHAIETGATANHRTGEVTFALPTEKSSALLDYLKENGVNTDSTTVQFSAQEGFANIIEAIKDKDPLTKKGFQALDWYFDTFKFRQHFEKFEDVMDGYQEYADPSWCAKYAEYMKHRESLDPSLKKSKEKPLPTLKEIHEISEEELMSELDALMGLTPDSPTSFMQKLRRDRRISDGTSPGNGSAHNTPPSSLAKLKKLADEYQKIKLIDPSITAYKAILVEKTGKEKNYRAIRFGDTIGGNNVTILIPIQEASSDASFVWVGQTGNDRDGWIKDLESSQDSTATTSKNNLYSIPRVFRHYHVSSTKQGLSALDNMWRNIYKDIRQRTKLKIS